MEERHEDRAVAQEGAFVDGSGEAEVAVEDRAALDRLVLDIYPDLQEVARFAIRRRPTDTPSRPTELVHEAYVRLRDQRTVWSGREHLLGVAARVMRRILVDRVRAKHRIKRGGGLRRVDLAEADVPDPDDRRFLAVAEALERLQAMDPTKARMVELRYVAGLTLEETARSLGISHWAAKRSWSVAKRWLSREIEKQEA